MGTTVSITVGGELPHKFGPDTAQLAIDAARAELRRIGTEWYPWASDGELVRLNAALSAGQTTSVSPELAQLLQRSQDFFQRSEGAFDPAVGGLVRLWGFDSAERAARALPAKKQLDAWQTSHPTIADIRIEGLAIRSERRDVVLDLGAIGKGYAVDRAIDLLKQRGIRHALVNAGGNLRAMSDGHSRAFRVAIRDPRAVPVLAWLELRGDEGVATSGDYERFAFVDGKRIHHLLDPRSGRIADHTIAVTVVAADATTADAASTAIFVAGPERWQSVARALNIEQVLRVNANGRVQVTRKLRDRLQVKTGESRQTDWESIEL